MHTPTLRLISLHPSLSATLSFVRVPEIHEAFLWKVFFARTSTARDVIDAVVEELGLAKTLPIPGVGTFEYVLEEISEYGKPGRKSPFLVPPSSNFHSRSNTTPALSWLLKVSGGSAEEIIRESAFLSLLCTR